jgi:hypothetical protein
METIKTTLEDYIKNPKKLKLNKDFRFTDLRERSFIGANFKDINLSGADLSRANFLNCNFTGANLSTSILKGTTFRNCVIDRTVFYGSDRSQGTKFIFCAGEPLMIAKPTKQDQKEKGYQKAFSKVTKERKYVAPPKNKGEIL